MAKRFPFPVFRALTQDGSLAPLAGGKLYAFEAGTSTPKDTFTDSTETTTNTNPVILDANGEANVWLGSGFFKLQLDDSNDVTQWVVDNVSGDEQNTYAGEVITTATSFNVTSNNNNNYIIATATLTINLLSATTAGSGFFIIVRNDGAGTVTIDPNGTETIDGGLTLELGPEATATIICDGSSWTSVGRVPSDINVTSITTTTLEADDVVSTDFQAKDSGGGLLKANNGTTCATFGAGGVADFSPVNLTLTNTIDTIYNEDDLASDDVNGLATQKSIKAYVDTSVANIAILRHEEAPGTNGGTATSGSWQIRTVNGVVFNNIGAALMANQITLTAGTYEIEWAAPFHRCNNYQSRLQNITDGVTIDWGTSGSTTGSSTAQAQSIGSTVITIAGTRVFELQGRVNTTRSNDGFGVAAGFGSTETYTRIKIKKIGE